MEPFFWLDASGASYDEAFELQMRLHRLTVEKKLRGAVLFQENEPLITAGVSAHEENLLASPQELERRGLELRRVNRGGDYVYHGPGQLVISPVLRFREFFPTVVEYLRTLEETAIRLFRDYGVETHRIEGKSGVFYEEDKLAALGIAVSHSVTLHGLSVNVSPDLSYYDAIIACGLSENGISSLQRLLGKAPLLAEVRDRWLIHFENIFSLKLEQTEIKAIEKL